VKVVLVHHAEAASPAIDSARPLTARGHEQADQVAARLQQAGFVPAAIWHSGKLRARQTAEACLGRANPFAEFRMVRGLRPDDPPGWIGDELRAETRDVLVVGHMPNISDLARTLLPESTGVPLHGFVMFERDSDGAWKELET
jgi:phosphohistidine phosphatase